MGLRSFGEWARDRLWFTMKSQDQFCLSFGTFMKIEKFQRFSGVLTKGYNPLDKLESHNKGWFVRTEFAVLASLVHKI